MRPINNKLLVKVDVKEKPKKGEEQMAAVSIMNGEVIAAGTEVKFTKKGDKVIFAPFGIDQVNPKENLVIVDETLILAVNE